MFYMNEIDELRVSLPKDLVEYYALSLKNISQ